MFLRPRKSISTSSELVTPCGDIRFVRRYTTSLTVLLLTPIILYPNVSFVGTFLRVDFVVVGYNDIFVTPYEPLWLCRTVTLGSGTFLC